MNQGNPSGVTKGPHVWDQNLRGIYTPDGVHITDINGRSRPASEDIANGMLYAEAGTVFHETGLTPVQLGAELFRTQQERDALRNLANNLQPGPISEAMAGTRYTREDELLQRNAMLVEALEAEKRRAFQDARISYRGFSYGVSSQWGIDSLRSAIKQNGDG
jgi:hypothetical protein